jgi:hypothetical protein
MTEEEFRKGFDAYRAAGKLAFVADDKEMGIAVGMKGPELIVLDNGGLMAMALARFIGPGPGEN